MRIIFFRGYINSTCETSTPCGLEGLNGCARQLNKRSKIKAQKNVKQESRIYCVSFSDLVLQIKSFCLNLVYVLP